MSDAVWVAYIAALANVLVVLLARLWSRSENKDTKKKIERIEVTVNGRIKELLEHSYRAGYDKALLDIKNGGTV